MKESLTISKLFLIGIIAGSLSFSFQVLDPTLTPRCIAFSVFVVLALVILFRYKLKLNFEFDIVSSSYIAFTLFCVLSIFWCNTTSEAVFESNKTVLALATFLFTGFCLRHHSVFFTQTLLKFSVIIVFIGFSVAVYQSKNISIFNKESLYAISSVNGHKNLFASFLFLNLFFLIHAVAELKSFFRLLSWLALLITTVVLILIQTKAVWIGLIIAALIISVLYLSRKLNLKLNFYIALLVCLILANLFFAFAVPLGIQKGLSHNQTITNTSTPEEKAKELDNERLMLWLKTYDMISKHPVLGVGMGNWQIYFPDATLKGIWRAEDLNFTFQRPHNDLLWILSETGWIGFNLFLLFVLTVVLLLLKGIRSADLPTQLKMMLCIAFISGFYVVSFFDFPKERVEHLIWCNIILAFGYWHIRQQKIISPFKIIAVSSSLKFILFVIAAFTLVISVFRFKGEYYTVKMYNNRASKEELKAIYSGYNALSLAYSIDPTSVPIYWYTANSYANLKNYKKSEEDFILAYKLSPYNRNVLSDLASSYFYNGNTELAKKYFNEALRISPRFDDPKLNLAALYIKEQNWAKADTCLSTMFKDSERRSQYQKMVNAFMGK